MRLSCATRSERASRWRPTANVVHCDAALPARFVRHAWRAVQQQKAQAARTRIEQLVIRLENILRADFARSEAALAVPALQASFGSAHHGMFDFQAMSQLLSRGGRRAAGSTPVVVAGSRTCSRY